jgi:hypothetical protein
MLKIMTKNANRFIIAARSSVVLTMFSSFFDLFQAKSEDQQGFQRTCHALGVLIESRGCLNVNRLLFSSGGNIQNVSRGPAAF